MKHDISSKYHKTVARIIELLEQHQCWYETFEHEATRTCEDVADKRKGYTIHQGAKALVVRVKFSNNDKRFMMLVIPASMRLNSKKVKAQLHAKDLRFATEAEVHQITDGVQLGGIPAMGTIFGLTVVVDPHVLANEKIAFNAGDRCFSIGMKSEDYRNIVNPRIEAMVE
ncbi:MAG: YbaK/prolyl-tRNA synthetase associated domain-containing protein [Candidatus Roizmanbacteria bacterium]|nr:YbaK/prolyl-tRNA synthetase associated domain-containing protein [Candidatus Roizmanbacteria bacterium]